MEFILKKLLLITFLFVFFSNANANSLLIWPIYPKISEESNATSLWMVNKGSVDSYLQVRIFKWEQNEGEDSYSSQSQLIATPPFVKIEPGEKQLIRIINQDEASAGKEYAYRVIIDELPPTQNPQTELTENELAVKVRMRYSIPLFIYGKGLTDTQKSNRDSELWDDLQAQFIKKNNQRFVHIKYSGKHHVRLVNLQLNLPNKDPVVISDGLAGYILPEQYKVWSIPHSNVRPMSLSANIGGKRYQIPLKQ
ncbi:molecular chaperone [Vibrio sp. Vb0592]|uniref:fimbrial biogenesis chaperone n=1 Tax=unclassified Vibrio TaxID=2614977 RepID=UPI001A90CAD7|nr:MULTISPECIES: molecular chaperone [unclassified Vibrio]MBO0244087.1 molecular chaperone [Vibrio sp. Vb0592]MDW1867558.1 molecular chaperone [Vibrio sp. Vb1127]